VLHFFHADVFAPRPFTGNGLGVFPDAGPLSSGQMQALTQELRQFECVFVLPSGGGAQRARIFTMDEELPFAGHPLLGAGAVLHHLAGAQGDFACTFELTGSRRVAVRSSRTGEAFQVEMDQGAASFGPSLEAGGVLAALGLQSDDLAPGLPLQVVSTGLPYLLVPLRRGLDRARILHPRFESLLADLGAKFVYLLDVAAQEGRTWDNLGAVEDAATGSAAGPVAAYLVRHGRDSPERWMTLTQGRFAGRPSELQMRVAPSFEVMVRGTVFVLGEGHWLRLPVQ
jgi:trans-2,3-dihydro-3-hydroxyanthranilate isomerase